MGLNPRISKAVYTRDDWKCRHCNNRNGLHPHHVIFQSRGDASTDTLDNLLTLCWKCHHAIHDGHLRIEVVSKTKDNLVVKFWRQGKWKP
jgi:5-methylcytosine-specific restriction endonuclease McrA